ncbi:MAG TPA: hypothetical protein VG474_02635 [Solirubrobacteraceae bacterium]|nr:hypothetical protein [Solirubrobacteraceae bacterium]
MTRQGTRRAALATAVAVGVALGGCGDDAPSRQEFVADANEICKRHHARISEAASRVLAGGRLPSPREFGELARETIIPEYTAQIEELRAVEPSEGEAEEFRAWLDESAELRERLEQNPTIIQNPRMLEPVNAEVGQLGLAPECRIGPG